MPNPGPYDFIIIFFAVAIAPCFIYLFWLRHRESFDREPISTLLLTFVYGATVYVIGAIVIEVLALFFLSLIEVSFIGMETLIVAPIVEEALKPLGVWRLGRKPIFNQVDDGIVYGAASGLGFAATENLFANFRALTIGGYVGWLTTAVLRAVSSTLIHAAATGTTGWGIGKRVVEERTPLWILVGYIIASILHGVFNWLIGVGIILAVAFAFTAFLVLSRSVK